MIKDVIQRRNETSSKVEVAVKTVSLVMNILHLPNKSPQVGHDGGRLKFGRTSAGRHLCGDPEKHSLADCLSLIKRRLPGTSNEQCEAVSSQIGDTNLC